jgi:hypothetical protein
MRRLALAAAVGLALVMAGSSPGAGSPKELAIRFLTPAGEPGIGGRVTLFALPSALAPGTTIEAAAGGMSPVTVRKRAWLFWEDLGHGVLFPHPSVLLLLDDTGAVLADRPMTSFPLIDGSPASFVASATQYLRGADAIYDRHPLRGLSSATTSLGTTAPSQGLAAFPADALVTIGARDDPTFAYDFAKLDEDAKTLNLDNVAAEPSAQGLIDAIAKLAAKQKKDIAIFVGGHGYAAPGEGRTYTDKKGQQIQEPESKTPKVLLKEDGKGAEFLTPGDLTRVAGKFPQLTFKVVINSCHAGRFLTPVAALANVKVVLTATDAGNVSVVGFGAAIGKGLVTWAATPGASDLATGLRAAFASEPVKTWAAELPGNLHPQISGATTPTQAPTPSTPSTVPPPPGVVIAHNELGWAQTENICQGATMSLAVTIVGIPAGTAIQLKLTGPGLPASLTFQANPGQQFVRAFPVRGPATWTDQIVSIGGKPPPSAGAQGYAHAEC